MIAVSKTNTGLVRTANEDALLTDGPELFAMLMAWAVMPR